VALEEEMEDLATKPGTKSVVW